jgi:hypothetical protein
MVTGPATVTQRAAVLRHRHLLGPKPTTPSVLNLNHSTTYRRIVLIRLKYLCPLYTVLAIFFAHHQPWCRALVPVPLVVCRKWHLVLHDNNS